MKNILHFSHINLNSVFGSVQEQAASTSFNFLLSTSLQDNIKGSSNAGDSRFCEWRDYSSESTIVISLADQKMEIKSTYQNIICQFLKFANNL